MADSTLRPVSMTGQAAWQDLLRLLRESAAANLRGTPKLKTVNGRPYWFDQYRLGDKVVEKMVGADEPGLRARMERTRELRAVERERERERARLVRILRAEGFLYPDLATGQLLMAMARAGTFRLGGTVVGTQAFRHYEGLIGVHLGFDSTATTRDIDIASFERLSVALATLGDGVEPGMERIFGDLEFEPIPALGHGPTWRWRQTRQQMLVEFLTPSFEDDEGLKELPALGVAAQSLHFLNYLIAGPVEVPLLYRSGAIVRVPRPERFAVHKLIVAERRRDGADAAKARKDRAQAALLIGHLAAEDPHALLDALDDALGRGRSWRAKIAAGLARLPAAAAAIEAARVAAGREPTA